ncbi:hypothetical protein QAD02_011381 [Eretmocerus hayati]|uniref:Uncharacterized protein n=1 Tax=Eretmocerus hayati TaxID=131215 RepID=A0ACC2NWB0_9HYME|nr:hypothetical protein QAD02_011381 [Eretmocerus hayati]
MAGHYRPGGTSTFNTDDEQFFKEYCISDLSQYLLNKVALRWRTKKEVISGKGENICADKSCSSKEKLTSWEVNFGFIENGQKTNQLVKLKLCKECSTVTEDIPVKDESQTVAAGENQPADDSQLWKNDSSEIVQPTANQNIEEYLSDLF